MHLEVQKHEHLLNGSGARGMDNYGGISKRTGPISEPQVLKPSHLSSNVCNLHTDIMLYPYNVIGKEKWLFSSVGVGMGYGLDGRGSTPSRVKCCFLFRSVETESETQLFIQ
jgi:hypothetical protein